MTTAQPPPRTCCRTHGNVRGVHENGNGPCEWIPVDAPTEQEWRILEEIRRRDDGRPDGALSGVLATWAQGKIRLLLEPAEPVPTLQFQTPELSPEQLRELRAGIERALHRKGSISYRHLA